MLVGQEVGDVAIGAAQLGQHIGRVPARTGAVREALPRDHAVQAVLDDVVIDLCRVAQRVARHRLQRSEFGLGPRELALLADTRGIVELRFKSDPRAGVEAERGRLFGAVVQPGVEEPVEHGTQFRVVATNRSTRDRWQRQQSRGEAGGRDKVATMHERSRPIGYAHPARYGHGLKAPTGFVEHAPGALGPKHAVVPWQQRSSGRFRPVWASSVLLVCSQNELQSPTA